MTDNIRPDHYRQGEIDLFEEWYLTYPFEQYRAIMQSHAEKYLRRDKVNRVEDLGKAIYTLERLREKEIETAGQYLDEVYRYHDDLLKRLRSDDYKYLARDYSGYLFAYAIKPKKDKHVWTIGFDDCGFIKNDNFPGIKWADDEPTKIAGLLATYENGGESGK